jgi:tetratricopeptide (TPR) repeat protein
MRRASHMSMVVGLLASVTLGGLVAGSLGGCTSRRPLPTVRKDADLAFQVKKWEKAEADYQEYLDRRPFDNEVRFLLGQSQLEQGKTREANSNFGIALDVDPLNDGILDTSAEGLYQSGNREALTAFLQRAASERGRVADYMRMGKYMQLIGHVDEAQQAYLTAAKIDQGRTASIHNSLADFYLSIGDRKRAVERLRMAYFITPQDKALATKIRELGEIPGPTFALMPTEWQQTVAAPTQREVDPTAR